MIYKKFIDNILETRGRFNCGDEYCERRHIIPKCMGGTNDEENLIDLYAKEHFEAHRLLALENPDNEKLVYAWWNMCSVPGSSKRREKITSEEYEEARMAYVKKFSGKNNPFSRAVIRLKDEKIYDTVKSCYIENNISSTIMYDRLKQYCEFMYYDEWINLSEYERERIKCIDWSAIEHINRSEAAKRTGNGGSDFCSDATRQKIGEANSKYGVKVYCPELDKTFITIRDAERKNNLCRGTIGLYLRGKLKSAGNHPVTGEKLTWVRLENKN